MLCHVKLQKNCDNVLDLLDLGVFVVDLNSHSNVCATFSSSMSKTIEIRGELFSIIKTNLF